MDNRAGDSGTGALRLVRFNLEVIINSTLKIVDRDRMRGAAPRSFCNLVQVVGVGAVVDHSAGRDIRRPGHDCAPRAAKANLRPIHDANPSAIPVRAIAVTVIALWQAVVAVTVLVILILITIAITVPIATLIPAPITVVSHVGGQLRRNTLYSASNWCLKRKHRCQWVVAGIEDLEEVSLPWLELVRKPCILRIAFSGRRHQTVQISGIGADPDERIKVAVGAPLQNG